MFGVISFSQEDNVVVVVAPREVTEAGDCSEKEVVVEYVADGVEGYLQYHGHVLEERRAQEDVVEVEAGDCSEEEVLVEAVADG